tara:strand:- start:176 stop:742 length:567 start_codon:yes stop_codon:yes gene_type:complete
MVLYESLHESIRKSPIIWKGDYPYFVHSITDGVPRLEPDVLEDVLSGVNDVTDWNEVDLIIGIEAMGLPLVAPTALRMKKPMVVIRKRPYGLEGELEITQNTGYSESKLFINDVNINEKVLIIDDVISTGGTLDSVISGIHEIGGIVSQVVVVVEKNEGMTFLKNKYPNVKFDSIVKVSMNHDKVIIG